MLSFWGNAPPHALPIIFIDLSLLTFTPPPVSKVKLCTTSTFLNEMTLELALTPNGVLCRYRQTPSRL